MLHVLLVSLLALGQAATAPPQPTTIKGATPYVYKTVGAVELRLHVFSPAGLGAGERRPAIVFFFGGGWAQGTVEQFVPQAWHLAGRGMVAIVADYRVFNRHGTSPFEAMADARSAVRWIRAHAAELRVDLGRVAAAGGSAGGHLALSAATIDGRDLDEPAEARTISSKPTALVLFNPVPDTTRDVASLTERFGARAREASPFHHLDANLPPTIILHGRADATVPYAEVERFCAEAIRLGNHCQLVGYDDAAHGFFNPGNAGGKWFRETLLEADRFLTSIGYLPAPFPASIP